MDDVTRLDGIFARDTDVEERGYADENLVVLYRVNIGGLILLVLINQDGEDVGNDGGCDVHIGPGTGLLNRCRDLEEG